MSDIVGIELRTTELTGALDVRGTSAKRGPKRSVDRIPDVSLKMPLVKRRFLMSDIVGIELRTTELTEA